MKKITFTFLIFVGIFLLVFIILAYIDCRVRYVYIFDQTVDVLEMIDELDDTVSESHLMSSKENIQKQYSELNRYLSEDGAFFYSIKFDSRLGAYILSRYKKIQHKLYEKGLIDEDAGRVPIQWLTDAPKVEVEMPKSEEK